MINMMGGYVQETLQKWFFFKENNWQDVINFVIADHVGFWPSTKLYYLRHIQYI